ncbi:TonB-dependent receptor [Gimibacter soli]|uniref:TonB-dependent receptor n=1 Tax=Gimibacter soli TaxID=3024400 RepID=A0AAE9XPA6_9PROT|nr:TonB-dependent receptor [Gimibacter soli]WCL54687.1 TonB-dependent receptor [Gimibacter soli]
MSRTSLARALKCSASYAACIAAFTTAPAAFAVDAEDNALEEIVVTGVRASLQRSIDLKRQSNGVVDGISAEDIGKFPDTNLAESMQRIPGVSIDRVNGEGSKVTVRGFGPGYNLVTLNGRALPTASIETIGTDQSGDFATGTSRSFDFSNLASEGVSRLEVYKTSRASVTSGGLGAAINVVTRKPLDGNDGGFTGSIGGKAVYDEGDTEDFSRVTPELSGLLNWANDEGTFGIGLFGSWQRRNNSAASVTVNDWNTESFADFSNTGRGRVKSDGTTVIEGAPSDPNQLVAFPNDTRFQYSEFSRERTNGQLTLQFKPSDTLNITADATYYENKADELRTDQTNWLNRPFDRVTFDGNPDVATAIFIDDIISGTKDGGFEQQYRGLKNKLFSTGLNIEYKPTERLTLKLDGQHSKAQALPNNPLGHSSTLVAIATKDIADQTFGIVNGFPVQTVTANDNPATGGNGNANGQRDVADLGSQVARSMTSAQVQKTDEIRLDGSWDMDNDNRVDFGGSYRDSRMHQTRTETYQALGDWGVANVGDIAQYAGDLVTPFCLVCEFSHFDPMATGASLVAFRGDATELYTALGNQYPGFGNLNGTSDNRVNEKIWAAYAQVDLNAELLNRPVNVVAGVRYEHTKTNSVSVITPPAGLVWYSNNDFIRELASGSIDYEVSNSYNHILPALDISVDLTDDIIGRVSWGRTIARPSFGDLFSTVDIGNNNPNRPTFLGGTPNATAGNPELVPLVSDNFDVSFEWYYADSSFLSVGFFDKRVKNFVGRGQDTQTLFDLRDPGSGAAGTRSGAAVAFLNSIGADLSDDNLFTMTALIDTMSMDQAQATFLANYSNGGLGQAFIDQVAANVDIDANSSDPFYQFRVQKPVNNEEGHIWGWEIAGQHFFGDTGFGVSGAYTIVEGDIGYDITAPTNADQFALLGLSDTANATLIFEKYGFSARLAYNWRGTFLNNNSRGSSRAPVFVKSYDQLDVSLSYDVTEDLSITFEGINLTKSNVKTFARTENQPWFIVEGNRRFLLGARYKF